MFISLKKSL